MECIQIPVAERNAPVLHLVFGNPVLLEERAVVLCKGGGERERDQKLTSNQAETASGFSEEARTPVTTRLADPGLVVTGSLRVSNVMRTKISYTDTRRGE
jgi:hypothetical protein